MSSKELNTFPESKQLLYAKAKDASVEVGVPKLHPLATSYGYIPAASEKACQLLTQDQKCSETN